MKAQWEMLEEIDTAQYAITTERLRVPGGWIYKIVERWRNTTVMSTCFVPVPKLND